MNIFVLDWNPQKAAEYHCDKHVNKMIVEHLQMMSVALDSYGHDPAKKKDGSYYSTRAYKNHPCTKWVKESFGNFMWLYSMTLALCKEFKSRYGKNHAGSISLLSINPVEIHELGRYPDIGWGPPAQAMPDECKHPSDAVVAYRNYYNLKKWEFAKWDRGTPKPGWWAPRCELVVEGEKQ